MDENGFIICPRCKGKKTHSVILTSKDGDRVKVPINCIKCRGKGKLDWIKNIVGV